MNVNHPLDEMSTRNQNRDKYNSESIEGIDCGIEELVFIIGGDDKDVHVGKLVTTLVMVSYGMNKRG